MTAIYLLDAVGLLNGPVDLPVIPGLGRQLPGNAIELPDVLPDPAPGNVWALVDGQPQQLADHRGTLYRTDTGGAVEHRLLGPIPMGMTTEPRPTVNHIWSETEGGWVFSPPEIRGSDVDAERDRRISSGFEFHGVRYQSRLPSTNRAGDWDVFSGKALEAFIAVSSGVQPGDLRWSDPGADFAWIAADNTRVPMDAQTVIELCKAASEHRSRHTFAGSDLKSMQPIPEDYTDNKWWP